LRNLARRLDEEAPGVAASILEGLDEMLTVNRLGLPIKLRRSLACTNSIENMMGTVRRVCRNVKRWRNAAMALRWTAAGMMEAAKGFRRLKVYKQLPVLRAALAAHESKYVTQRVDRGEQNGVKHALRRHRGQSRLVAFTFCSWRVWTFVWEYRLSDIIDSIRRTSRNQARPAWLRRRSDFNVLRSRLAVEPICQLFELADITGNCCGRGRSSRCWRSGPCRALLFDEYFNYPQLGAT
jgi:hypothetical protein